MNKDFFLVFMILLLIISSKAQGILADKTNFNRQDSLRGSITKERIWWDLTYYHLDITIDPENRTIKGSNEISYTVIDSYSQMQIDLQEPLNLIKAEQNGEELVIRRDGNAHFITLKAKQIKNANPVVT